ncbi:MAG TPA: hypothetical protein DCS87_11255 [Rheinheimera sp.]|nr:hypothetical protein [Rheinheimera sp.]
MTEFTAFILDDDEFILRALQRTLKRLVPHWHLQFFQTFADLLPALDTCPTLQLVISDRMMPDCHGEEVLAAVQKQRPAVIRCLLTGDTSADVVIQDSNFIHHFLAKPFTENDLLRVFSSVEHLHQLPLQPQLRQELGRMSHLPILPCHFFELQAMCQSNDTTAAALAMHVSHDPVLTGRLLQLANSPFMGYSRATLDLQEAIQRLGFDLLQSIAIMLYSQQQLQSAISEQQHRQLLLQAWQRAGVCKLIAHQAGLMKDIQDKAFMLGLLSGLGELVLAISPELALRPEDHLPAAITAYLLTLWGFEGALRQALLFEPQTHSLQHEAGILQLCWQFANQLLALQQAAVQGVDTSAQWQVSDEVPEHLGFAMRQLWQQASLGQLPELGVG